MQTFSEFILAEANKPHGFKPLPKRNPKGGLPKQKMGVPKKSSAKGKAGGFLGAFAQFTYESVSEAVNKEGYHKGLVLYHGTSHKFDHFSDDGPRHTMTPAREIKGHFFTPDANAAYTYASRSARATGNKQRVIAAHLHMDNPYDATKEIKKHQKAGMSFSDAKHKAYSGVDRAKHDGVYHNGNGANHAEYVAFHGHQVKPIKGMTI